jgi:hypothetical protein
MGAVIQTDYVPEGWEPNHGCGDAHEVPSRSRRCSASAVPVPQRLAERKPAQPRGN